MEYIFRTRQEYERVAQPEPQSGTFRCFTDLTEKKLLLRDPFRRRGQRQSRSVAQNLTSHSHTYIYLYTGCPILISHLETYCSVRDLSLMKY